MAPFFGSWNQGFKKKSLWQEANTRSPKISLGLIWLVVVLLGNLRSTAGWGTLPTSNFGSFSVKYLVFSFFPRDENPFCKLVVNFI